MSHVSPDFIPVFGDCIRMAREVLFTQTAQPFIIAGSGTLGWDEAGFYGIRRYRSDSYLLAGQQQLG
jgi:aspartate aminotransferase-like enzyme